jgi:hypothetical protein
VWPCSQSVPVTTKAVSGSPIHTTRGEMRPWTIRMMTRPTSRLTHAARLLFGNLDPATPTPDAWSFQHPVLYTLLWIGIILLVIGLVALARTGIPADSLTDVTTTVGPFTRTPLMAIIEIILGLLVIVASADADRASLLGIGMIALVFGIVWMIEPGAFEPWLGIGRDTALLYLIIGIAGIVVGLITRARRVREVERY